MVLNLETILMGVGAGLAIALIVILFIERRRIAASISGKLQRKSKAFRIWAFASFFWVLGVLLYSWAFPYWLRNDLFQINFIKLFWAMIVPPLFFGAMWFGYQRFVGPRQTDA